MISDRGSDRAVKVGLLEEMSTPGATKLGVSANIAAHTNELIGGVVLAIQDVGRPIRIIWRDDQRNADGACRSAQSLIDEGVAAVVGHLSASAALPAAEVYTGAGMVFLAPGTTHPALTASDGGTVFRLCGRDDDQARLLAGLVGLLPRRGTIAVLAQDIAYGRALAQLLADAFDSNGLDHLAVASGDECLSTRDLEQIERAGADALVIAGIHEFAASCCRRLDVAGYGGLLVLGDDGFTPNLMSLAGDSVEGAILVAPGPAHDRNDKTLELTRRYRALLGSEPGAYFLTSYAATWILLQALEDEGPPSSERLSDSLRGRAWRTPVGELRFDKKGEVEGLGWTTYRVRDGRFVPIDYLDFPPRTES